MMYQVNHPFNRAPQQELGHSLEKLFETFETTFTLDKTNKCFCFSVVSIRMTSRSFEV